LHFQCFNIGEISNGQKVIEKNTVAWVQAEKMITLYQRLYMLYAGDEALMNNWLRKQNQKLQAIPLYVMVDDLRIDDVLEII